MVPWLRCSRPIQPDFYYRAGRKRGKVPGLADGGRASSSRQFHFMTGRWPVQADELETMHGRAIGRVTTAAVWQQSRSLDVESDILAEHSERMPASLDRRSLALTSGEQLDVALSNRVSSASKESTRRGSMWRNKWRDRKGHAS